MLLIKLIKIATFMSAQHSLTYCSNSVTFFGRRFWTWALRIDQRFSIGFRSGDWGGQSSVVILLLARKAVVFADEWQGALSCIRVNSALSAFITSSQSPLL